MGRDGAVLVLGASRGLGRAIAVAAAEIGFAVVLGCRNPLDGERTVEEIIALGGRALCVAVDVTDYASVADAVAAADDFGSGLTGLVNNAGVIAPIALLAEADPRAWAEAIAVNVIGPFNAIQAALPRLVHNGVILNLSSGAAHVPIEGWSAYCASKAALAMLTRSVFLEYGQRVRVYGVQPGMVDTDMQSQIRASGLGPVSQFPRKHLSPPAIPARAASWLLRYAPADLNGTEVDLDAISLRLRMGRREGSRSAGPAKTCDD
ncbi:MAG TPA: SDR family oxidoreductase [Devosia sp.]|nr:SDR family oxidoreductase [Devosia sp.]